MTDIETIIDGPGNFSSVPPPTAKRVVELLAGEHGCSLTTRKSFWRDPDGNLLHIWRVDRDMTPEEEAAYRQEYGHPPDGPIFDDDGEEIPMTTYDHHETEPVLPEDLDGEVIVTGTMT